MGTPCSHMEYGVPADCMVWYGMARHRYCSQVKQ